MEPISNPIDELGTKGLVGWARCPYTYEGLAFKESVDVGFSILERDKLA
jgi:hypothetical protein